MTPNDLNNLIRWIASLDNKNRERLARAINNQIETWKQKKKENK